MPPRVPTGHAVPEVSVLVPCRDGWPDVRRSVAAALAQRDVTVEVIVVDDGSDVPLARQLGAAFADEPRLRVVRHERPRRQAAARNHALAHARGDWVAFLDHDDLWAPHKLRTQLDAASTAGADWTYGAALVVDEHMRPQDIEPAPPPDELVALLRRRNCVPGGGSSVLARTELVRAAGGFDGAFTVISDWDLWLRLAHRPAAAVTDPLVAFVRRGEGLSVIAGHVVIAEGEALAAKHRASGAQIDIPWLARWTAGSQRRGGKRIAAARTYLGGARHGDVPGGLVRAALALVEPGAPSARGREAAGARPLAPAWLHELP